MPRAAITEWGRLAPWPTVDQVEQDLVLLRLIVELAHDDYLGEELMFRGGTCLHKLFLPAPLRYSEDLDYVRATSGGIRDLTRAVGRVGERLGMEVRTRISQHPKIFLRAPFESGTGLMRIKVEVNTYERSPARPVAHVPFQVRSTWYSGEANVLTFALDELVATKIRALFQRSKGRDLFDLWVAITQLGIDPADLVSAFDPYRPDGYTSGRAIENLREKLKTPLFRDDLVPLVTAWPVAYRIEDAADLVIREILERIA